MLKGYLKNETVQADEKSILRALPIWPYHNNPHKIGCSAQRGICCKDPEMLMPWIKNLADFIDPCIVASEEDMLTALGCNILSTSEAWEYVERYFPTNLNNVDSSSYRKLLEKIARSGLRTSLNIAPNGHRILCSPRSLYDSNDEIFSAAFRGQEATRFLHKDFRGHSLDSFWKSTGLRARPASGDIDGADFLQCALAIKSRKGDISNTEISRDAEKVAAYLSWNRQSLRSWSDDIWSRLWDIDIFAVADGLSIPLDYQRSRMLELAQEKSHCSLKELGREADRPIIWSQKPFPKSRLTSFAFERLPNQGRPTATSVLWHVKHLIGMRGQVKPAEAAEYLRDLQASYEYLQDQAENTQKIPGIRSEKIWINLDTTDVEKIHLGDIESALCPAQQLCMNCPSDPLPLRVVRKFLVPYEKLLGILGCRSVIQPAKAAKRPMGDIGGSPMILAMREIQKFRQEGVFVDIIFQAQGMDKPAHKIFMAAVSKYCKSQFTGEWGEILRSKSMTIQVADIKFKTLSHMVDFAYTGEIEFDQVKDRSNNDEIAERLDDLLDLLRSTDMWILEQLHQLTEEHVIDHSDL